MLQRFKRWYQSGWRRWGAYPFTLAITGLTFYLFTDQGAAQYIPVGLGLLLAVVLSAYVGGIWAGLLSTLIISVLLKLFIFSDGAPLIRGIPIGTPTLRFWFPLVFAAAGVVASILFEALHRSRLASDAARRQLATTLANISDAVVTTDAQGKIDYVNQTALLLLQCDREQVIGKPFEEVVSIRDVADKAHSTHLVTQVRRAAHTVHVGNPQILLRKDGTQVAIEATAAPVRDSSGELVSVVVTLRDCSAQREVENVLRERLALQARFERIAAVVPGAIYEFQTDAQGHERLLYASPAFKEIFGIDSAALAEDAAALRRMVVPEDFVEVREFTDSAASELQSINIEQRMMTAHRGIRWITVIATPQRAADGGTLWHGIMMDTTELKRAGEQLRASQMQLRAALDAGAMGIISLNFDSGTVDMDATARRIWGLEAISESVFTFSHLQALLHPEFSAADEDIRQLLSCPELAHREYRLRTPAGEDRWVAMQGRVYRDEESGALMAAGVVMDITHNRKQEEQRLHSQKLEALGVLAGGIAHDFNNLLLAISGNADLLQIDLAANDAARTSVTEIQKATARATELVRRILNFSSVNEFTQPARAIAINPVLDAVASSTRASMPTSLSLRVRVAESLPAVRAEASQVQQAVSSLLTNAIDASSEVAGGVIELLAEAVSIDQRSQPSTDIKPGRYVRLSVNDWGTGIDPGILPRIFDPFFTTKATGRGTGLGLAIVHGIMKNLDGAVTVSSVLHRGTTFSLYFPASITAVSEPVALPTPTQDKRAAHILYVDDEESLVFLMARTLERMGHRVTACESPEQALQHFLAHPDDFDLVVSDMAMPVLTGIELAERILEVRPQLPFIITSGFVDAADAERAKRVGVRRMIMKPNTVEELSQVVTAVLRDQVGVATAS